MELVRKRHHILLVEDNPGDADAVSEALRALDEPADLVVVRNGYSALDYLMRQSPFEDAPRPDLVLLDLTIPGLGGRQVLSKIKGNGLIKTIPVVMFSSACDPATIADCQRVADGYIVKPRTWAECIDRMRVVLRQLWGGDGPSRRTTSA